MRAAGLVGMLMAPRTVLVFRQAEIIVRLAGAFDASGGW